MKLIKPQQSIINLKKYKEVSNKVLERKQMYHR